MIEIAFLSGSNPGSIIKLPVGTYTFGNTDDCDFAAATDSNENVVAEVIIETDDTVTVKCVEGVVFIDKQQLAKDNTGSFEVGQLLKLSLTNLCYRTDPSRDFRQLITSDFVNLEDEKEDETQADAQEKSDAENKDTEQTDSNNEPVEENTDTLDNKPSYKKVILAIVGAVVLLVLFIMLVLSTLFSNCSSEIDKEKDILSEILSKKGFDNVDIIYENEMFELSGYVADDIEYETLKRSLPELTHSIFVNVDRISMICNSIARAFELNGLTVNPVFEKGSFHLKGYVLDPYVLNSIYQRVSNSIPSDVDLKLELTYKDKLETLLNNSSREKLVNVKFYFKDGSVIYQSKFTPKSAKDFELVQDDVQNTVGSKIAFINYDNLSDSEIELLKVKTQKEEKPIVDPLEVAVDQGSNEIAGVTVDPIKFVTLKNGEKIFEGGLMPDGSTLIRVYANKLLLNKGGKRYEYELK